MRDQKIIVVEQDQAVNAVKNVSLTALLEYARLCGSDKTLMVLDQHEFDERQQRADAASRQSSLNLMAEFDSSVDLQELVYKIKESTDLLDSADQAPVVRLLNAIISDAVAERASDIHIENYEATARIRFRIDGMLRTILEPGSELAPLLISRLKILSGLDIAEKRLPQDGRMSVRLGKRFLDLRVSTIPSTHGERVVLRILEKQAGTLSLDDLGIDRERLSMINDLVNRAHGIFLVTGPTGSGKTTTLYAALQKLDAESRNIMTVEDPVEYDLPGVSQTQINSRTGMSFAKGLRALLRQDPDVILIGEIRDRETAEIAVQASLTGHLVLSTLHTNNALGAITRLQDLGIDNFMVASTLTGILAQRLVRKLCEKCRQPGPAGHSLGRSLDLDPDQLLFSAVGCLQCNYTGYNGRVAIFELVIVDSALRQAIHEGTSEAAMEEIVRSRTLSLRGSGFALAASGQTTLDEVLRVTVDQ